MLVTANSGLIIQSMNTNTFSVKDKIERHIRPTVVWFAVWFVLCITQSLSQ